MYFRLCLLLSLLSLVHTYTIPYPPNVQSEGVTHAAGSNFFFGDLRSGDIYLVDVSSRLVTRAVRAPKNRRAVGIYARKGRLFAAGGTPPALHVYEVTTGRTIASCAVDGAIVNDVVADSHYAYYTASRLGRIYKLSLEKLPKCEVEIIDLPKPPFTEQNTSANANGLLKYKKGLIVVHYDLGTIFFVDLLNGNKLQEILPPGSMPGADGLDIDRKKGGSLLFVAQNIIDTVSVWQLGIDNDRKVSAALVNNFTSPDFRSPTTVAITDEYVVTANPNFQEVNFFKPIPANITLSLVVLRRE